MTEQIKKWLTRSELTLVAAMIAVALLNHFLEWGIPPLTIIGMFFGTGTYALSRGMAKKV